MRVQPAYMDKDKQSIDVQKSPFIYQCLECTGTFSGAQVDAKCPHDGSTVVPMLEDPLIGSTLGDSLVIRELIGRGGTCDVYRAFHRSLNCDLAIKIPRNRTLDSDQADRFFKEAEVARRIVHSGAVRVVDAGADPFPYLVMELAQGRTLSSYIAERGHLDWRTAVDIAAQVARALSAIHHEGFVHRDLKPSNVMLEPDTGRVKILDFGIVKDLNPSDDLTRTGQTMGSFAYMSPEQCKGDPIGTASDMYSLGCLLFEMLTGTPPFRADHAVEYVYKHLNTDPPLLQRTRPDLSFPSGLQTVLHRLLAKDDKSRYADMESIDRDLMAIVAGRKPTRAPVRKGQFSAWKAVCAVLAGLVLGSVLLFWDTASRTCVIEEDFVSGDTVMLPEKLGVWTVYPGWMAKCMRARTLTEQGHFDRAEPLYLSALKDAEMNKAAWWEVNEIAYRTGSFYVNRGRYHEAIPYLKRSLSVLDVERAPIRRNWLRAGNAHLLLGEVYLHDGDLGAANDEAQIALSIYRKSALGKARGQTYRALTLIGRACQKGGNYQESIAPLDQAYRQLVAHGRTPALETELEHAELLGLAFLRTGQPARALDILGPAVEKAFSNGCQASQFRLSSMILEAVPENSRLKAVRQLASVHRWTDNVLSYLESRCYALAGC